MNSIPINSEPVSTIKISSTTWQPNRGQEQQKQEKAEQAQAFHQASLESGKDLKLRVLVLEHALADLQQKVQKIVSSTEE